MSFAENFKAARNKLGLSQEELANKLYISRQSISRYENGTAEPSIDMLKEICHILDLSMEQLIGTEKDIPEYREFQKLPRHERQMLWYDFVKSNIFNMIVLPVILNLAMGAVVGSGTYAILQFQKSSSNALNIMLLLGVVLAVLLIAGTIFCLINNSIIVSRRFNSWLRTEKKIIRLRKLMIF